jgi:hypothetical protein
MKTYNWRSIAELIGVSAIVLSLIFVGAQIRQEQNIALAQIFADFDDTQIEWARLVAENKDIWVRGLKNEVLSDSDGAAFNVITAAFFDKESTRLYRAILITGVPSGGIIKKNADIVYSFPGLSAAWRDWAVFHKSHQHSAWFYDYIDSVDASIDEIRSGKREHDEPPAFGPA